MNRPALHTVPESHYEIDIHRGPREELRTLFALAEDSPEELERYFRDGRVLIARGADGIIGHLQFVWTDEPAVAEIKNMAVVEMEQQSGVGSALVRVAIELLASEGCRHLRVATAAADVTNLRFYQRLAFRLSSIERDAFDAAHGYAAGATIDGVELRDRVWLDRPVPRPWAEGAGYTGSMLAQDGNRTDRELVSDATGHIGIPRTDIPPEQVSFVLHAPLELLARSTLLAAVAPTERARARHRVAMLVSGYEAAAPAFSHAETSAAPGSAAEATEQLAAALVQRDVGEVDVAAQWLDAHVTSTALARALAPLVVSTLAAAGHGNIYLALLRRPALVAPSTTMLRSVTHELVMDPAPSIRLPALIVDRNDAATTDGLLGRLLDVEPIGPPPSPFIAPLVLHAERHGLLDRLTNGSTFAAPARPPMALLRFAAQAMLQGDPERAPYGWTHCLTLAQGALHCADLIDNTGAGTYVATAYLVAHWGAYGTRRLDMDFVPAPPGCSLADALTRSPMDAAGAAWHESDREAVIRTLATSASVNHDAHRVKYTLACIDASVDDPAGTELYLAAAAYLNAWWEVRGDPADPLA